MRKKVVSIVLMATILAFGLYARGAQEQNSAAMAKEKVLHIAKLTELQACDPHKVNDGMSNELMTSVYDGLYTLDAQGQIDPLMAESYEVSADGLTYTFHLREAFWSNGDRVKAGDFVYSLRRLVDKKTAAKNRNEAVAAAIKNANKIVNGDMEPSQLGVKAVDDSTLVVELEAVVPYFLGMLIRPAFLPLNENFMKQVGDEFGMTPKTTVYNGPYVWSDWDFATNITAKKNPTYWNAKNIDIDEIDWKIVKDSQTGALLFENKELDFVEISGDLIEKYASDPSFTRALEVHMWYLIPNLKGNVLLQNENIRRALATSYDKGAIANEVMKNGAKAADYIVGYNLSFGPDGKQMRDTNGSFLTYDPVSAKEYWAKGLKELGIKSMTIDLLYYDDDASIRQCEFIASEWEKNLPGLSVTLSGNPKKAALDKQAKGEFDVCLFRWGPDYKDPMAFLELFEYGAPYNRGQYNNSEYNRIIAEARTPAMLNNLDARWESLKKAEKLLLDGDVAIFPTVQNGLGMLVNQKTHGLDVRNTGITWNYRFVTMDK